MSQPYLRTVVNAFQVLSLFSPERRDVTVKEASTLLKMPASNTHRLLSTLKHVGALTQDPATSRYALSLSLWETACLALPQLDIREAARPVLQKLGRLTSETIFLAILEGTEVVYVDRVDGNQTLRVLTRIGARHEAHCVASGLALLAFSPLQATESVISKGLKQYTPYTITSADTLRDVLEQTRRRGYSVNVEGHNLGVVGIAAPILDPTGAAVAAVSLSGPDARLSPDRYAEFGGLVCDTATEIAEAMGWH